jgi:hypothetical protein
MSTAAQAGIGIGVGAVVLGLLGVGLFFFMKSRRNQNQKSRVQSLEISQPLPPRGGRNYPSGDSYAEKNAYDMDLIANRYEDMVPRATPRNMV